MIQIQSRKRLKSCINFCSGLLYVGGGGQSMSFMIIKRGGDLGSLTYNEISGQWKMDWYVLCFFLEKRMKILLPYYNALQVMKTFITVLGG